MHKYLFILITFILFSPCFVSSRETSTPPCTVVVFGATGDLTARKLVPAIYTLHTQKHLNENTALIGFARRDNTDETFREKMETAIEKFCPLKPNHHDFWNTFKNTIFYNQSTFEDSQGYLNLKQRLTHLDQTLGTQGNRIYYLATPPNEFSTIIKNLHEHRLIYDSSESSWSRIILEKPFGNDLESAINLKKEVDHYLDESQIYLMDHYLGKEGSQNLMSLRFENGLYEPLWNHESIEHIQITLSEEIGIGTRGNFWEKTGSLRDVFQNHLMQLLSLIAMEPPSELIPSEIHLEKIKVLNAIRPIDEDNIIRAQYGAGEIRGNAVIGYKEEDGVSKNSTAETFVATKLFIDNPRWEGVPFYIRTGKRLCQQGVEIAVTFKAKKNTIQNTLFIRIQPNPGLFIQTSAKTPELNKVIKPVVYGYTLETYFNQPPPEAYEKLIYDCIRGDHRLYVNSEEQLIAWRLLSPILDHWKTQSSNIPVYEAGSWGPSEADELLNKSGHRWHMPIDEKVKILYHDASSQN